ncbi:Na+/Pi symporter [Podochytrium sp. JEL0797]|nr:Na+/Pi symporter [Podochytrium sp. JEL0797]
MAPIPMELNSYTWIFAVTICFAFLDAYAIGANDVANSFATSVGSRSLKLWQACSIAIFTEFLGAVALGSSTASTIKDGIIYLPLFDERQDLLMMAFMCALIGSSTWVMTATRFGWPVSTTHSIVGATIGVGVSGYGLSAVNWGWANKGVLQIVASWFISPVIAGLISSAIYGLTRQFVLKAKNPLRAGIFALPVYFTFTAFITTFFVASKNGKASLKITFFPTFKVVGNVPLTMAIVGGISGFVLLFCVCFAVPFFLRKLDKEEDLKWYHIFYIWAVPTQPKYERLEYDLTKQFTPHLLEDAHKEGESVKGFEMTDKLTVDVDLSNSKNPIEWVKNFFIGTYQLAMKGLFMDVASVQSDHAKESHAHATLYDNKVEYLFSFLQVFTAAFASFGHGSNDVANAIGPLAAVYQLWSEGQVSKTAEVELWMLAMGGIAIDCGLAFYGWRIMINLGNNLTYHSPSRGFAMELAAALTVISASFLALPVSTTQCIVGATIGVGLMNGSVKAINWKMVGWTCLSWLFTLPVAGISSGVLYAILSRGPSFSGALVAA